MTPARLAKQSREVKVRFPRATRPGGLACRVWLRAGQSPGLMTATRPPGCFAYRPVLAFWL